MVKNVLTKIVNAVSLIIIAAAVLVLLSVVMTKSGQAPNILGYSMFRVMTGSMEPSIPTGSLILVRQTDPREIEVNDVISFYSQDPALGGAVNTHRVTEVSSDNGRLVFGTKGDANNVPDIYPVYENMLVGKVVGTSYFLGVLVRLLANPIVFIPLIAIPLFAMIILNVRDTVKAAKTIAREEEEREIREAIEKARQKRLEQKAKEENREE